MRINPVNFYINYNRKERIDPHQSTYIKQLLSDSICFKGIKKDENLPKQAGIKVGREMLRLAQANKLNRENLSSLINANTKHEIEIRDINEIRNAIQTPGQMIAYMQPYYDNNFNFLSAELYLQDISKIETPEEECDFIANSAHEFTHIIQREKDKNMDGFLKYSNDMKKYKIISITGFRWLTSMVDKEARQIFNDTEKRKKAEEEIENGKFDFSEYAIETPFADQISDISGIIAVKCNYNPSDIQKMLLEWIYNVARDEEEAYEVTEAIYNEHDSADKNLKMKRVISKEVYKYIADKLEPAINEINKK